MKTGLVGNGRWGKKIKKKLLELGHSVKIVKEKKICWKNYQIVILFL